MTVIDWLLNSDPSIRWQVLRDLTDTPPEAVAAERARVATEGLGRGCSVSSRPTVSGVVGHGTEGGTRRCTSFCCCGTWVSILQAVKRAGRWDSSATG